MLDIEAIKARLAAARDDDYANIPEDMADNIDAVFEDTDALIAEITRLREVEAFEDRR